MSGPRPVADVLAELLPKHVPCCIHRGQEEALADAIAAALADATTDTALADAWDAGWLIGFSNCTGTVSPGRTANPHRDATTDTAAAPVPETRAEADHGEWSIRIYDDQPVPEGKKYAPDSRVVLLRNGEQVREFLYPGYRIWTLLAHWTEGLDELAAELDSDVAAS